MTTSTSTASSYPGPGVYFLKNVATGTVVDLTNGTLTGRSSNFGVPSPSAAQTWQIAAVSPSQVIILNSTTGEYIKAPADNSQNPSAGTGAPSERRSRFEVEARSDGSVIIRSALDRNKVFDLDNSGAADGTKLLVFPYHGGSNQRWILVPVRAE